MKAIRSLSLLAMMFAATALTAPAIAAPATGPNPLFTGGDLFDLEWASDPQISPDGRTIAYVRESNDIMTDKARRTIWLVDVASGQQRPLLAGAAPISRRAGRPTASAWPMSPPRGRARSSSSAGWEAGRKRADNAASRTARQHRLVAGRPPDRLFDVRSRRAAEARQGAADKPEGAKWADPLQVIDTVTYRFDDAGYLKPGYEQIFWVPADGGAPTQLTFGATNAGGRVSWTPDGRSILFSANLSPNWEREPLNKRSLSRQYRWRSAGRAHRPRRAGLRAGRLARRPPHRLSRLRRPAPRLPEHAPLRDEHGRVG